MNAFKFKHFSIQQKNAALKVGTDAMLLGALCSSPKIIKRILDIGTGTGVLALMTAQRFSPDVVVGVEMDENAIEDAQVNFLNAPFSSEFQLIEAKIQEVQFDQQFDLIVSNPPYFMASVKNKNTSKSTARHTDSLSYLELLEAFHLNLAPNGLAWCILPIESLDYFKVLVTQQKQLHLTKLIIIQGKPALEVRFIACLSRVEGETHLHTFCIRDEFGAYTPEYIELTKDFHDRDLRVTH